MSTSPSDKLQSLEQETLERQLAQMSLSEDDPLRVLAALAESLFPGGQPTRERLTWAEEKPGEEGGPQDAEARLRAAELRFRTLVEQIPAVTFLAVLGQGKNEIYVSPHIERMLGFSQKEWLEAPFLWYFQLHPDDRQLLNDEFARGCRTGGPFRAECRFIARDGRTVWVHGEARLVKDEIGRPAMLQGVAFDITENKRAQELLLERALREAKQREELAIARRVQTSILPRRFEVPGIEIATLMTPAEEVGGDYYDVMPTSDGAWLAIGDVSGHGLDSGLVMLMMQSAMAALARVDPSASPADHLVRLNEVLYDNVRARMQHDDHVTFTLLRYHDDGRIEHAGAHEDLLVYRAATGQVEAVATSGTWLGGRSDIRELTRVSELRLHAGDVLLLHTDGITEAMNRKHELFEVERLIETFARVGDRPCAEIRDEIIRAVEAWMWEQKDDMTLVVVRHLGNAESITTTTTAPARTTRSRAIVTRSIFDSAAVSSPVAALVIESPPTRLGALGAEMAGALGLRLSGVAEYADRETLRGLVASLHARALEAGVRRVEVDFRPLAFLNSSCFKELVTWLGTARALASEQRYQVRFVSDPGIRWQRASVSALMNFAAEIVEADPVE